MAPTLWLIYCNDLPGEIEEALDSVALSQFADDTAPMATPRLLDEAKKGPTTSPNSDRTLVQEMEGAYECREMQLNHHNLRPSGE